MTEESWPGRDLWGDPCPEPRDPRGRKRHKRNPQIAETVALLRATEMTIEAIALQVGLSEKTLTKNYSRELQKGPDLARGRVIEMLYRKSLAGDGNVTAGKAFLQMTEMSQARQAAGRIAQRGRPPGPDGEPVKPDKLGKKEERQLAAQGVSGKYAPPAAPKLVVDNR